MIKLDLEENNYGKKDLCTRYCKIRFVEIEIGVQWDSKDVPKAMGLSNCRNYMIPLLTGFSLITMISVTQLVAWICYFRLVHDHFIFI